MRKEDLEFFEDLIGDMNAGFGRNYNLFACEEGIKIAESLKNKDKIIEFHKETWENQKLMVPTIDDGHSGNTFGLACKLAIAYLPMIRDRKIDTIIT